MKIALIPVYVDYYESTVPGLLKSKEAFIQKVNSAITSEYNVALFDKVKDADAARSARERLSRDKPDCVIVLPLVATFSALTDELIKGWKKPVVLFSPMMGHKFFKPMTMTKVVAESQSFGAQAIANGWMRAGVKFRVIHQIAGTQEGNTALSRLLKTLEASMLARKLRIGLIGEAFTGMTDVLLPVRQFQMDTGSRIVCIPMKRVHDAMEETSAHEIAELERELRRVFTFGRFSSIEMQYSLRAAVAIRKMVGTERLDCAAFNSHSSLGLRSKKLGLMCALGITLATTSGCPISEVGDLCTAFALWLGRKLSGACFYTELDSAYISAHHWLLLNSGEHDLAWLRGAFKPKLLRNTNFKGANGRGASVCAPLRIGPATMINFTPTPSGEKPYRIQFCEGTIDRDWHPEMGVGNAHFRVKGDARAVYESWLAAGPVHHSATCPGHLGSELSLFCETHNWDCLQIN
jgi:L-arabinose isomerase